MLKVISVTKASDSNELCVPPVGMSPGSVAVADAGGGGGGAIPHIGISPAVVGRDSMRIKVAAAQKLRNIFIMFS
ncbi:MAG: hypothetical protein V7638_436 [Acidobacteriota bacterium]|jgi:hypothetical protein